MSEKKKQAKRDILQSVLTWSHVLTMSILALAALHNVGGLAVILFRKELADAVIRYTETWQTFFIAGILGYDAKSTIENVLKISGKIKELREAGSTEEEQDSTNG